jgi:hypothetical protein
MLIKTPAGLLYTHQSVFHFFLLELFPYDQAGLRLVHCAPLQGCTTGYFASLGWLSHFAVPYNALSTLFIAQYC